MPDYFLRTAVHSSVHLLVHEKESCVPTGILMFVCTDIIYLGALCFPALSLCEALDCLCTELVEWWVLFSP